MATTEPETVSVRIKEFQDQYGHHGHRTDSYACNPAHVVYLESSGRYLFQAWEANVGTCDVAPKDKVTTEKAAREFTESKLREMLQFRAEKY